MHSIDEDLVRRSSKSDASLSRSLANAKRLIVQYKRQRLLLTIFTFSCLVVCDQLSPGQEVKSPAADEPPGRRVFVPVEELESILQQEQKWVLLSNIEFARLYSEAKKNTLDKPVAPVALGVRDVKYSATVIEEQLVIEAKFTISKFMAGWEILPLEFPELSVEDAQVDNQPAKLGRDPADGGRLLLFLQKPGKHQVAIRFSRPFAALGSDKLAAFGLAPFSNVELTLEAPPGKHLQWNGLALERPAPNDQPAQFKLALGGQKRVELRLTDRPTEQKSDGLVFAHTVIGLRAAPEEITWEAITSLQVFGKPLDQLTFRVPENLQIISIASPGLESWEFGPKGPENGETLLNLRYRQPFQEAREIIFQAVLASKAGESWQVPNLKLANVSTHTTEVVIATAPGMRVQLEEAVGAQRFSIDPKGTKDVPPSAARIRFRGWREDFVLRFSTQPFARELAAAVVTLMDINSNGIDLQSRITVQSRFAPLFDLSLLMPAEWTVNEVQVNEKRVAWESVPQEAGIRQIRLTFDTPVAVDTSTVIQLNAHHDPADWPLNDGTATISLADIRVMQANVVEGTVVISAEPDLELRPAELKGLDPTAIRDRNLSARLSYEYQDIQYGGQIVVSRKPARISATTISFHRLDRETLFSFLETKLSIQGGSTRRLNLSLPESVGVNQRFEMTDSPARIVEQIPGAVANGRRTWTLLLDQRIHGTAAVRVEIAQPRGNSKQLQPPTMQVVGADREMGSVAFEAEPDQQLDLTAKDIAGNFLPDIDPADLLLPNGYFPKERIVAAYHYVLPGSSFQMTERRFERMPVPTAICDSLEIKSVLGETGEFQHSAEFKLRAVGVQSLQVNLPEGAQLWATLLDDAPIEVRRSKTTYLIPLMTADQNGAPVANATAIRDLKLFYRTEVGALAASGHLRQTPPAVTVLNGDGSVQPLEILSQAWTVHHPPTTDFVSDPGSFIAAQQPSRSSLLDSLVRSFRVDSPRNLFWKSLILVGICLTVWLVRVVSARRGLVGLAGLGAVATLLAAMTLLTSTEYSAPKSTTFAIAPAANYANDREDYSKANGAPRAYMEMAGTPPTSDKFSAPAAAEALVTSSMSADESPHPGAAPQDSPAAAVTLTQPAANEALVEMKQQRSRAGGMMGGAGGSPASPPGQAQNFGDFLPPSASEINEPRQPKLEVRILGRSSALENGTPSDAPGSPRRPFRAPVPGMPDANNQVNDPFMAQLDGVQKDALGVPQPQRADQVANQLGDAGIKQAAIPVSRAVLSLALALDVPADYRSTNYSYTGRVREPQPQLIVNYLNRNRLGFEMIVVEMFVVLLCWFIRHRSVACKGLVAAFGIGLPMGLATIIPIVWLPLLDGTLCGTLIGIALWCLVGILKWFSFPRVYAALRTPLFAKLTIILLCLLPWQQGRVWGQEQVLPPPPPQAVKPFDKDTLLIPFEAATDPLKSDKVLLPYERFLELWKQGHPDESINQGSPVPGMVTEALYSAELLPAKADSSPTVKVTGRFVCHSLQEGQIRVTLPLGKVAITAAQLNGKSAPLFADGKGNSLQVLLDKPGPHIVDIEFTIAAELVGPAGHFQIELVPVPSGTIRFKVPAADLNFRVNGSSGAFRRLKAIDSESLIIPISHGGKLQVNWQPKQDRGDVESIVHVESTTAIVLQDEGVSVLSNWQYLVRQGAISELRFAFPDQLALRKISGPDVGGWEVSGEGDQRQLKVFLRRKVEASTEVKFDLFLRQAADDLETTYIIPQFAPQGITRETGTIAVSSASQFGIRVGNISGLSQIETTSFPLPRIDTSLLPPTLAYRFSSRPYQLELIALRRLPQLKVVAHHHAHIDPRRVQFKNQFQFQLTGAPRSTVTLYLPQGYLLQSVQATAFKDWHLMGRGDSSEMDAEAQVQLEFETPRTGIFEVVLIGKTLRQPSELKSSISLPYPLDTDHLDSQLLTTLDPIYTASVDTHEEWKSIDPATLISQFLPGDTSATQFAFNTQSPAPSTVELTLSQLIPRLSAAALTVVTVEEDSLDYLIALQWNINAAGAESFVFTTPDTLADRLEFPDTDGPRRRSILQEPAGTGRTRWTITLEDPQRDRFFIAGRAVRPPVTNGEITAPSIIFEQALPGQEPPIIEPLETQQNYVVLVNHSQSQLTTSNPEAVEAISAEDLSKVIKLQQDLIVQAAELIRVRDNRNPVKWSQQRFQAEQLLPASVNLAHHVTVLTPDGSWREQVTYRIRNRSRQFLALKLPAESQVLSLFVKGLPARPVQSASTAGLTLIPLPKTVEGDVSFEVNLILSGQLASGPLPRTWSLWQKQIVVPAPTVVSKEENPEYGIPVAQSTWTVYFPEELDGEVWKSSIGTNVIPVSSTLQAFDQATAILNDASELIAFNSFSRNRRAKAQAMNNLKNLKIRMNEVVSKNSANNSAEVVKQRELQARVSQLESSIEKVIISNSSEGLRFSSDAAGNTVVLDETLATGNNLVWLKDLNDDNGVAGQPASPNAPEGKPAAGDGQLASPSKKGNLNRGQLRSQVESQVQELSAKQQSLTEQRLDIQNDPFDSRKPATQSYGFDSDEIQIQFGQAGEFPRGQQANINGSGVQRYQTIFQNDQQLAGKVSNAATSWSSTGGLSLAMQIPSTGQKLSFSKVGGEPRLTLLVRPRETLQLIVGVIWSAVWVIFAALIVFALSRPKTSNALIHQFPWFMTALGVTLFLCAPQSAVIGVTGLVAFLVGIVCISFRQRVSV